MGKHLRMAMLECQVLEGNNSLCPDLSLTDPVTWAELSWIGRLTFKTMDLAFWPQKPQVKQVSSGLVRLSQEEILSTHPPQHFC